MRGTRLLISALAGAAVMLHGGALTSPAAGSARQPAADDPVLAQGLQWGLELIGAPDAWSVATGDGVTLAIIDSGADLDHEDLAPKITSQVSCVGAAGDPGRCSGSARDDNGHGTHVAGVAAAATGNGRGIAGVAPDADLMIVRVLADACTDPEDRSTCLATGTAGDVSAGIRWAVDNGADVINLSLGGGASVEGVGCPFCEAIRYAWDQGAIAVVAAGNESVLPDGFADEPAVVVAATTRDDSRSSYSAPRSDLLANARWAVAAPGGEGETDPADCATGGQPQGILSTYWIAGRQDQYACLAGTSMAAPHVAGALAVLRSQGRTPADAVERLLATAVDLGPPGPDATFGSGRIDLARAVDAPIAPPTPTPTDGPPVDEPPVASAEAPPSTEHTPVAPPEASEPVFAEPDEVDESAAPVAPVAPGPAEPSAALIALAVAAALGAGSATTLVASRTLRPPRRIP